MYEKVYSYKVIKNSCVVCGYINANSIKDAIDTVKYISNKQVFVSRSLDILHFSNTKNISEWFSTLFMLLSEGIKIESCLEIINQNRQYGFSIAILDLIRSGFSFSEAIKRHSFFFGDVCSKMVDSVAGFMKIEDTCFFLHNYYAKLSSKISDTRKIVLQPLITFVISVFIMGYSLVFVNESIRRLFLDLKIPKPAVFKFIDSIDLCRFLFLMIFVFLFVFKIKFFAQKIPFVRSYYENRDIFISFYCISKAVSSGVQIIDAIEVAADSVETNSMFIKLKGIKRSILNGKSIYKSFIDQNIDVEYCEIMRVGEITGRLSESFLSISSICEKKLSRQFDVISNTLPYIFLSTTSLIIIFFFFFTRHCIF